MSETRAQTLKALPRDSGIPNEIWVSPPSIRWPTGLETGSWSTQPENNTRYQQVRYVRADAAPAPEEKHDD